jgi:hypothetical protein
MRRLPSLDLVRRELRGRVCTRCPHGAPVRPHVRTDTADTTVPAALCEGGCPIFVYLPALVGFAERLDPLVGDRKGALRRRVAALCARPQSCRRCFAGSAATVVPPPRVCRAAADAIVATVGE